MAGVNKVILVGNLGADPEVRNLEGGNKVATLSIATSENYTDRDGNRQTQTEWHRVNLWNGLAGVAEQYLKKGSKVYIEGRLTTRSYEKDGVTRYSTDITARDMVMLDSRQDGQGAPYEAAPPQGATVSETPQAVGASEVSNDDPPF
ncbi:single-stranded DNA-binding protein [Flammeovirga yaeyamensis]|uniref:Single-stranded DNA-binding protein n=1 Tax=Flammeovirga yaeyamensis TaxID=367791 RepID=A0AAX1N8B6_9BACT|nr:single-stranded DNA-binding protein [Flammeovirga yaeyamensis]MBB3699615.1 single-strand DNA-binding protein [Flammeovirga yaeyamensis]NMF36812.1 single-stranded DNA-binding protein [Flammeovirga yaeyamensis]QWG02148.1 single-stranded DNA-binding protein [Flammeovirga yaeyamensis]